jgi:2',5'-phosphodiesterase
MQPLSCFETPLSAAEPPSFRVLTYNLLADQYASKEHSQKVLFAHTPAALLDIDFRKQRILRQLLNSAADVCCLQEVDQRVFERYLELHMRNAGFVGVHTTKAGQVSEGSAIFFRSSHFELTAQCAPLLVVPLV